MTMYTTEELQAALAATPAPSLLGIGDNVLDCYLHEDLAYPGGNALNVAAYSRLFFGGTAGFLGILGDDRFGVHLQGVLDEIGVDRSRARTVHGANGMAFVSLDADGDRRFVASNRGGVQEGLRLRLGADDLAYIAGFTRVHTSVYSALDGELARLAENGARISYDYSDDVPVNVVRRTAAHVDIGFFSGGTLSDTQIEDLAKLALGSGMGCAVVTQGSRGAHAFTPGVRNEVGVRAVEVVDALGAGDAFITGFLAARASGADIAACLETAATAGALACTLRGAFGYPVEAGEDAQRQMLRRHKSA
ncbi:PfkB family carbohydrate kinase [Microbacterium dextranolyticum]|nr:PfkB family carbohydrate kinase [Microbacterium dextranolyticum]MBM7464123.1 fructoselysine 6-kinase [Microbacterium dextranolyticum]